MSSEMPPLPIKSQRSFPHVVGILPSDRLHLPGARLAFSIYLHDDGATEVLSATLRLQWPDKAQVAETVVCDGGVAVIEIDQRGRIASIEATSYAAGPMSVPGVVAAAGKQQGMIHALATLWIQWAVVQAYYRSCGAGIPHRVVVEGPPTREWMMTSSDPSAEQVW